MTLSAPQVEALRELGQVFPETRIVVIGAAALGFYCDMRWRKTSDVDLVVALDLDQFPGPLAARPGWTRHPRKHHEYTSPRQTRVDILPAGRRPASVQPVLRWPDGRVMNLAGVDLAFDLAESRSVVDGGDVLVAPPPVVVLLKMASYLDRPADREHDLEDIAYLLDGYVDDDSERRFEEAPTHDFDLAPAYLLGRDLASVAEREAHRRIVEGFMNRVGDADDFPHALMRARAPRPWQADERFAALLGAFRAGLSEVR